MNINNINLFIKTFRSWGYPDNFIAGLGGNWAIETAHSFEPNQVQLSYLKKFGTCDNYVKLVDSESQDFNNDRVGFGYSQLTSVGRKTGYNNYRQNKGVSVADSLTQFEWANKEIYSTGYANVRKAIKRNWNIADCARVICTDFERPASMQKDVATKEAAIQKRITEAENFYKTYMGENGMSSFEVKKCIFTNNDCYKDAWKMAPVGIIVHSTGANNPALKRYVQPDDGILGKNTNNNHWNKSGTSKCVHAFIGKDKNGVIRCYQTLPWNYCSWGIGRGKKGSYNYPATKKYPNDQPYIQFEICEDSLTDASYFNQVMDCAQELCVYLMKLYPAIKLENVISHHEGYIRGMGSGHSDCDHWLSKFGKTMDWFRSCVQNKLGESTTATSEQTTTAKNTTTTTSYQNGDVIELVSGATYYNGKAVPNWVLKSTLYYRGTNKNGIIISTKKTGAVTGTVKPEMIKGSTPTTTSASTMASVATDSVNVAVKSTKIDYAKSYDAKLKGTYKTTTAVNIRSGAGAIKTKLCTLPSGTAVIMNGYYTAYLGVKWYLISFTANNKSYSGFIHSKYIKK